MNDKQRFVELTRKLAEGLLREAIGYSIELEIPYYHGTVGYMVEAPMLWIRHSRFPILFLAYNRRRSDILDAIVTQLQIAKATEFFALLVVVPTEDETGNEADDVRRLLADTVYRYDFVVLDRQALADIIAYNGSHRLVEIILKQGIELSNLSPYVVRGPVSEKMFFGREREIKAISQGLNKTNYAIVGGRRIGKSSILQRLNRLLNHGAKYRAIYVDCEEKFNHEDLFLGLFGEPLDKISATSVRQLIVKLYGEDMPARQIVFLLDEVDELLAFDAKSEPPGQLFKTFRALSLEGFCRFVFSGSRTLYQHLHDAKSPFFNFCEDIVLKPLEQKSVAEIITKPMHQLGIEMPDEEALIDRIVNLSSCHPNIAQWLCDRLLKTSTARRITMDGLEKIASELDYCRHYIQTAWGDATPLERLISLAADGPTFEFPQLCQKMAKHGVTDKTLIRDGLEKLELYSLIGRNNQQFYFALAQFPTLVRQSEDVDFQIESLLSQVPT